MTDKKISELTNITGSQVDDANDELAIVDASANETKAITRAELFSGVSVIDVDDDSLRIRSSKTPASASATGTQGQIAWDSDYLYVCTSTDTWKRVAIATW